MVGQVHRANELLAMNRSLGLRNRYAGSIPAQPQFAIPPHGIKSGPQFQDKKSGKVTKGVTNGTYLLCVTLIT
jgi:hypothetical protein